jgi:HAE1 family hydrophobic/amphiphilic exporter-1
MVQVDPQYLSGEQSLLSLPVYSPTLKTNMVIGQLGRFTPVKAPRELERYDRLYTAQYSLNLRTGAPPILIFQHQIARQLTRAGLLGNGVTISNGSRFGLAALTRQLSILGPEIFGLSILLAYLVMGAQFNSFRYPIYLLLPVPLALTGAIWMVFLLGSGLDVFGVMGMLMLIGLSAKNAILYLDFVVARLGKMPFIDALIDSARLRFRPIVMTTMTVLVISFPLIFSRGQGSEFGQRLGEVMLGGILFSAILTFFVVPAAFYLFERKRTALREQEGRRLSEIEEAAGAVSRESGI